MVIVFFVGPILKTGIICDIFNKFRKNYVDKERLMRYASGFAIIYRLIFSIFVRMLCWSYILFILICGIVELFYLFVGFFI